VFVGSLFVAAVVVEVLCFIAPLWLVLLFISTRTISSDDKTLTISEEESADEFFSSCCCCCVVNFSRNLSSRSIRFNSLSSAWIETRIAIEFGLTSGQRRMYFLTVSSSAFGLVVVILFGFFLLLVAVVVVVLVDVDVVVVVKSVEC